jgi:hypothetical protein
MNPGKKADEKTTKIADAVRNFAVSYKAYLTAYGNVKRFSWTHVTFHMGR